MSPLSADGRSAKRQKIASSGSETESEADEPCRVSAVSPKARSISPPLLVRRVARQPLHEKVVSTTSKNRVQTHAQRYISSPVQLTTIRDLPSAANVDTVSLRDILGDPLIKECFVFDFLIDIDFVMSHLDADVQSSVQMKFVHGSWKREDSHRIRLEEAAGRWPNVQLITAHMPEAFGTHHSKMMVLIRHDDTAQVIIHTANMIFQDWTNLCQAVWCSPLLPLLPPDRGTVEVCNHPIGSGERFKADLLRYLDAYKGRLRSLTEQLKRYDFGSIRAALLASVPSKENLPSRPSSFTAWGWPGLQQILRSISSPQTTVTATAPQINVQISSVATLSDKWLDAFFDVLSSTAASTDSNDAQSSSTFFAKPKPASQTQARAQKPKISIVFPTDDEVRRSLDGYQAGSSIHMKIQSAAQIKQLAYLKPHLCLWAGDRPGTLDPAPTARTRKAGRRRAAPHIKTFVRFADASCTRIDWAMVTSANLSTQAWGALPNKDAEVRICSYEIGVVVWPALFDHEGREEQGQEEGSAGKREAVMVPTFMQDSPDPGPGPGPGLGTEAESSPPVIVGFRMPYDLPLVPYAVEDVPWCASARHATPDWKGVVWEGYQPQA